MRRLTSVLLLATCAMSCGDKESDAQRAPAQPTEASFMAESSATIWAAVGEYKGLEEIDATLRTRLMADPNGSFTLANYLKSNGASDAGLSALLGQWTGNGLEVEFRSGKPNAVNFVLWHIAITGLAQDLAGQCPGEAENPEGAATLALSDAFKAVLEPMCHWPLTSAKADEALEALWLATMAFDAPKTELDAFKAFAKDDVFAKAPAREATAAFLTAIMLNPHFLLRK